MRPDTIVGRCVKCHKDIMRASIVYIVDGSTKLYVHRDCVNSWLKESQNVSVETQTKLEDDLQ